MKGTIFLFLSAVALSRSLKLNAAGCPIDPAINILFPHENCNQYYQCKSGDLIVRNCPTNLVFNAELEYCDWPENVNCDRTVVPPGGSGSSSESNNESNESSDENDDNESNNNPGEAAVICAAEGSDGKLIAHENCNQFYKCSEGLLVALSCPLNLLYNPEKEYCDWPENVNCDRSVVQPENPDNGGDGDSESGGNGDGDNNGGNGVSEGGNNNPGEAAAICAVEGSDGKLVAHENCNQFYKCLEGIPYALSCPPNLLYNPEKEYCDWPENVNCDRSVVQPETPDNGGDSDSESGGDGDGDNNGGGDGSEGGNNNPGEAAAICAAEGSDGKLVAHENCNQFYKCLEGLPVALSCPLNLLYNPEKEYCDWPENVNCDRSVVQPENPDNGGDGDSENGGESEGNSNEGGEGSGNSDPSEVVAICAADGSDVVLVAHENCNQFYKCSEGKPVTLSCPSGLLYNAANEQCDWPENVVCKTK
ncbi:chondroitin proteoglycan 2 [Aphomia sociella]